MRDVATRQVEKVFRHMRVGTVISSLGLNVAYNLVNLSGLSQSVVRIGVVNVLYGLGKWAASPVGAVNEMHDKSEQMRMRALTLNREVNEIRSAMLGRTVARAALDKIMFFPTVATQLAVDTPTWWGAYHKAQGEGRSESTSIAMADQAVVDSQSGGQIKDLAGVQRGNETFKLLTVFYGYWNATWNLTVERTRATDFTSPAQVALLARDYMLLYAIPAVFYVAIRGALSDGDDDDFWKRVAAEGLSGLFGSFVGAREAQESVKYQVGKALGDESAKSFGYHGPAGLRFFSELSKLSVQASQGELDDAFRRAAVNTAGIAMHLPGTQINRTLDGFVEWHDGKAPAAAILLGKPKN
jgi:hypothetical protein